MSEPIIAGPWPRPVSNPIWELLGIELEEMREGYARVRLDAGARLHNPIGVVHGGIAATLVDSAVAVAVRTISAGRQFNTIELKINYVSPVTEATLFGEAELVHKGNRIVVGDARVRTAEGRLIAKALVTYMLLDPRTETGENSGFSRQNSDEETTRASSSSSDWGWAHPES